jgi:hypothetical protein
MQEAVEQDRNREMREQGKTNYNRKNGQKGRAQERSGQNIINMREKRFMRGFSNSRKKQKKDFHEDKSSALSFSCSVFKFFSLQNFLVIAFCSSSLRDIPIKDSLYSNKFRKRREKQKKREMKN